MRHLLLFTLFMLSQAHFSAQSCLPGGITFLTQADVDNFPVNHPGCTEIEGGLFMIGTDIRHVNGLAQIQRISGDMLISGNDSLENITGLSGLQTIGQVCRIQHNPLLVNLDGLENLSAVEGDFFYIGANAGLTDVKGLASLDTIGGIFQIWGSPLLDSLHGLERLKWVGGNLAIFQNEQLRSLDGLDSLTYVKDDLRIEDNPALNDVSALHHPISIEGALVITGNSSLSTCAMTAVCDYLAAPATFVAISGNATGCQSVQVVTTACAASSAVAPGNEAPFQLLPNPTTGMLRLQNSGPLVEIVRVRDLAGRSLNIGAQLQDSMLDLSAFPSGMYWVEIAGPRMRWVVPILVIRY